MHGDYDEYTNNYYVTSRTKLRLFRLKKTAFESNYEYKGITSQTAIQRTVLQTFTQRTPVPCIYTEVEYSDTFEDTSFEEGYLRNQVVAEEQVDDKA